MSPGRPVVLLLNSLTGGGSQRKMISLANALAREGTSIHFCYLDRRETLLPTLERGEHLRVHCLERRSRIDRRAMREFREIVAASGAGSVLALNPYQVWFADRSLGERRGGPGLVAATNTHSFGSLRDALLFHLFEKAPYRRADVVVFGSEAQKRRWCRAYALPETKASVIHNGVDLERFSPEAILAAPRPETGSAEGLLLVQVASLTRHKRHVDLLSSARLLLDRGMQVRLAFLGTGPLEASLRNAAENMGLTERVHFAGFVQDVRPYVGAGDVVVLPSNAVETFSNAVLEAMAMEKPVIVSRMGGAAEQVEHGRNGLLFEPGDVEGLAACIARMADPEFRREAGLAARRTVVERFGLERMVTAYRELLA